MRESKSKTLSDFEGGKLPGEEPPEDLKQLAGWIGRREQVDLGSQEYVELSQKIYDNHAEQVYMIGTVGFAPPLYIVKNGIGNTPTQYPSPQSWSGDQTFYAE